MKQIYLIQLKNVRNKLTFCINLFLYNKKNSSKGFYRLLYRIINH